MGSYDICKGKRVYVVTEGRAFYRDEGMVDTSSTLSLQYNGKLVAEDDKTIGLESVVLKQAGLLDRTDEEGDNKPIVVPYQIISKDKIISVGLSDKEKSDVVRGKPVIHAENHVH